MYDMAISKGLLNSTKLEYLDGYCVEYEIGDKIEDSGKGFSRINLKDKNGLKEITKYDIVAIKSAEIDKTIIKLSPDILIYDYTTGPTKVSKALINQCISKNIFIELRVADTEKGEEDKLKWLQVLRRILKFGGDKVLIISSGATSEDFLINEKTIEEFIKLYKKRSFNRIINNSKKCLKSAALKRHAFNNCISDNSKINNFSLKKEFIWNNF